MGFRIRMNFQKVKLLVEAANEAAEQVAYAIKQDIEEAAVVPFETGDLQNCDVDSSQKKVGKFWIVYSVPYARRLYWHPEYNFRTDKNPNARGEWLEPWLTGDRRQFARRSYGVRFARIKRKLGL